MTSKKNLFMLLVGYFMLFLASQNLSFANPNSEEFPDVVEKLGSKLDLNLKFFDETGKEKTLADMFEGQPTLILTLNYFRCTTMCTYQLLNLSDSLKKLGISIGKGYTVSSISFDITDDAERAQTTRNIWIKSLGSQSIPWHFYTSDNADHVKQLTDALNFYVEPDDEENFSHTAGLFFINRDGTLMRYLYGIVYEPRDIKYAILDTSRGDVGSIFDRFLRKFSKYNITRGKYEFYGS